MRVNFTGNVEVRNTVRTQKKYEALDQLRLLNFVQSEVKLTQEDEINITEAALIKYFDPEYNKLHKYFPKKDNKPYEILLKWT